MKIPKNLKEFTVSVKDRFPLSIDHKTWEDLVHACCEAQVEIENLQDAVETLGLQSEDYKTIIQALESERLAEAQKHFNIAARMDTVKSEHTRALADRETHIAKLLRQVENTEANRKYACDHIQQQNKLIQDAKMAMENIRAEKLNLITELEDLRASKINSEHLAKKLIELRNENVNATSDNLKLKNFVDTLTCPYQRTKEIIHIRCGKCTSCKLEAAEGIIERTSSNVSKVQKELKELESQLQFKNTILQQTADNIAAANKERDIAASKLREVSIEKADIAADNDFLKELIRFQEIALETIAEGSFFGHAGIAQSALDRVKKVRTDKKVVLI